MKKGIQIWQWISLLSVISISCFVYLTLQYQKELAAFNASTQSNYTNHKVNLALLKQSMDILSRLRSILNNPNITDIEVHQTSVNQLSVNISNICLGKVLSAQCTKVSDDVEQLSVFIDNFESNFKTYPWQKATNNLSALRAEIIDAYESLNQRREMELETQFSSYNRLMLTILLFHILASSLIFWIYKSVIRSMNQLVNKVFAPKSGEEVFNTQHIHPELMPLTNDLKRLKTQFTQLEKLKNAMLRHAAHELKTPLASISEGCDLLLNEMVGSVSSEQREVLVLQQKSIQRMTYLVGSLLDYNRLLQQAEVASQRINVKHVWQEAIEDNLLAMNKVKMTSQLNCADIVIHSDPDLLRRIFDNALSNAIAHGVMGSPISIVFEKSISHVNEVTIKCSNIKKTADKPNRNNLIEPFQRGNTQRNDGMIGAGLGLSIIEECTKLLSGNVEIIDTSSRDFVLQITLPKDNDSYYV